MPDRVVTDWEERNPEARLREGVSNHFGTIKPYKRRLLGIIRKHVGLGESLKQSYAFERGDSSPCKEDIVYFAYASKMGQACALSPSRDLLLIVAKELGVEGPRWIQG